MCTLGKVVLLLLPKSLLLKPLWFLKERGVGGGGESQKGGQRLKKPGTTQPTGSAGMRVLNAGDFNVRMIIREFLTTDLRLAPVRQ